MEANWQARNDECIKHLQNLIRLDTSNPPGNEAIAVAYIKEQIEAVGVTCEVLESEPGRANLRATLKGDGTHQPLLLMSHTDVVPVEPEYWTKDPFSGEIADGYVWGRGAVDMKQWAAWHLTIFLELARNKTPLKRDVVLLATADEEDGSYRGMRWIAENHPDWLKAEYGLSEGGGGEMRVHNKSFFPCRVAEKGACRFNINAHGAPGHASRPHKDNAIVKLGRALDKLGTRSLPLQATKAVKGMLESLLEDEPDKEGLIADLTRDESFDLTLDVAPFTHAMRSALNAQLHNTATPTILHPAGNRINVIPSMASASCDGRTLPGVSMDDFAREVQAVVGDEVEIEVYEYWDGSASAFDTDLFRIMKDVTRELTGSELVPYMATGASDARFAEPLGVKVYGFGLMRNEPNANPADLMHAHDERISLSNIDLGLRALHAAVTQITS